MRDYAQIMEKTVEKFPTDLQKEFDEFRMKINYRTSDRKDIFNDFVKKFNKLVPRPATEDWHFEAISTLLDITKEEAIKNFSIKK